MNAKEIAATILMQLGGNRFIAMTGAKDFFFQDFEDKVELSFKIMKNSRSINKVRIYYKKGIDLYDIHFNKEGVKKDFTPFKIEIEKYEDVYSDMLQDIFTQVTGLYTHL